MKHSPLSPTELAALCRALDEEIHRLVEARAAGRLDPAALVDALLRFERTHAAPHGLTLYASHTFDDWTVLGLRRPGEREPCACFEFRPEIGEFRPVGTLCREPDPALAGRVGPQDLDRRLRATR